MSKIPRTRSVPPLKSGDVVVRESMGIGEEKVPKKTRKGQIPLDHRINYALKQIKKQLINKK